MSLQLIIEAYSFHEDERNGGGDDDDTVIASTSEHSFSTKSEAQVAYCDQNEKSKEECNSIDMNQGSTRHKTKTQTSMSKIITRQRKKLENSEAQDNQPDKSRDASHTSQEGQMPASSVAVISTASDGHIISQETPKMYKCPYCFIKEEGASWFIQHLQNHGKFLPTKQASAQMQPGTFQFSRGNGKTVKILSSEEDHSYCNIQKRPHRNKFLQKSMRPKPFMKRSRLFVHQQVRNSKMLYKCDLCPKTFSANSNLSRHKRMHKGDKPHKCTFCRKRFMHPYILQQHMRVHTGEKPHHCNVCSSTFSFLGNLNRHIKCLHSS